MKTRGRRLRGKEFKLAPDARAKFTPAGSARLRGRALCGRRPSIFRLRQSIPVAAHSASDAAINSIAPQANEASIATRTKQLMASKSERVIARLDGCMTVDDLAALLELPTSSRTYRTNDAGWPGNGMSASDIDAAVHNHIIPTLTTWKADQLHRFAAFIDEPDAPSHVQH